MKKLVTEIREWLRGMSTARMQREQAGREIALIKECERELQVMEWNGGIYICYNGVPIINQSLLKEESVAVVTMSRKALKMWKEENDEHYKKAN
jgi:hypothetical protein